MTVNTQKPIVIFRGDNTAAFDLRTIRILLTGDLDLTNATARFDLLDFTKSWTTEEVATGELSIVFDSAQTKSFALGPQVGTLRLYDMSTGTPRQLTIVNKIPFFVTNRVCEIDSQSYEADVCVSGGDVIHIEFKVGAGAVEGKADKVKNATAGDLASLTADGNLEDSGIPKTDVLRKSQMDSTPTAGSQNPVTSDGIKQAIDAATPSDYAQVKAQVEQNTTDISTINGKIPGIASSSNKLVDQQSMNDAIATNTATFRGSYNAYSDLGVSPPYPLTTQGKAAIAAAIAAKLASLVPPVVPENNDYCFVQVPRNTQDPADFDPTVIERVDRYKCTVTESGGETTRVWGYEWSLNNSSFTADQWAAINSGITSGLVEKLNGIEAGAQVNAVTGVKGNAEQNYRTGNINLTPADIGALGNTGDQTLSGDLTLDDGGAEKTLWFTSATSKLGIAISGGFDDRNQTLWNWPSIGLTGDKVLALLSDMYAAVQQIAPEWSKPASGQTGTTYTKDISLCTYNGVLYQCANTYTTDSSSNTPPDDIYDSGHTNRHWVVKKVSELFLPLTGGEMTGPISSVDLSLSTIPNEPSVYFSNDRWHFCDHMGDEISLPPYGIGIAALLTDTMRFSGLVNYAVGDVVFYRGSFYRCTTAHTAGTWNDSHFTEVLGLSTVTNNVVYPTASTPTSGDNSTKVATTAFVKGALPYAIATVYDDSGYLVVSDRCVNRFDATSFAGATIYIVPPDQTAGKSRDFYVAVTCGATVPSVALVGAFITYTLINAKGGTPDLTLTANATTVLRFTEVANGSTGVNPVFVVTGGANGGGSVDPATLNAKANSTALAPDWRAGNVDTAYAVNTYITYNGNAYVCMVAYTATSSSPTPDQDIYNDTVTPATGHWKLTDMTTPDATLDVTSQGSLRVVSAGGQTLWQQGYKLASASSATLSNEGVNIFTFAAVAAFDDTASYAIGDTVAYDGKAYTFTSAHSGAWTGSDVKLAAQTFSLPAAPTGKVGDFILEIDNTANASVAVAIDIAEYTDTTISLVIPDGAAIDDMTAIGGGVRCEFYFTQTAFNVNSKPTWKVVRQDVEVGA